MKPMNQKELGMRKGEPDSEGFFPEQPHVKILRPVGEVTGFKYPDTEEAVYRDQEESVRDTSRAIPKKDFRH